MSVRVRKGGFMVIYFYVRILVPMPYLKLWNYIYICIYIYMASVRPSRRVRPVVLCLSVRPVVRPVVVVVRLLPVRPRPCRRRRPSSVRPFRLPSNYHLQDVA